jgi:hypothetical protein
MGNRGRISSASLSVVSSEGVITVPRPKPPDELTDEQAVEWRAIVDRLPADWFTRETWGLLVQYCRHVIAARKVAQLVASLESEADFDVAAYDRALKIPEGKDVGKP